MLNTNSTGLKAVTESAVRKKKKKKLQRKEVSGKKKKQKQRREGKRIIETLKGPLYSDRYIENNC